MLRSVWSGGQTGADVAALIAAKKFAIPTGGWMPKGFLTLAGRRPEYAEMFGMKEHASQGYPGRTFANCRDTHGTLRFAAVWESPGELCTLRAIHSYHKPYFDVDLVDPEKDSVNKAVSWLKENDIRLLNVAGNAEKTHPGTEMKVGLYLSKLFSRLGFVDVENKP